MTHQSFLEEKYSDMYIINQKMQCIENTTSCCNALLFIFYNPTIALISHMQLDTLHTFALLLPIVLAKRTSAEEQKLHP